MSLKVKISTILIAVMVLLQGLSSCNKEKAMEPVPPTPVQIVSVADSEIFVQSNTYDGFTWYKLNDQLYSHSSGSGHSPPYFRTRFNAIAAAVLDSIGRVKPGTEFPEGSLIVKELREANYLVRFAIMYKNTGDKNADSRGWLWAYLNPDGVVAFSVNSKGSQCVNCHSQSGNIDGVLMEKFYP